MKSKLIEFEVEFVGKTEFVKLAEGFKDMAVFELERAFIAGGKATVGELPGERAVARLVDLGGPK